MSKRPQKHEDGFPTRADMLLMSAAEIAITEAMHEVEAAGASPALTDAVVLLGKARDRVADHVEGITDAVGDRVPASTPAEVA